MLENMFMELNKIEIKSDPRGSLFEIFKLPNDGQIFSVVVKPNESRGNHYHLRKTERFLVIFGSAEISSKDRSSGDVMKVKVSGNKPISVTIPPNNTHSISASNDGCILLVWVDEQYDENDSDTYGEEL